MIKLPVMYRVLSVTYLYVGGINWSVNKEEGGLCFAEKA